MKARHWIASTLLALVAAQAGAFGKPPAAAIASAHPLATAAGEEILAAGGNAFDAAVAIASTLAVVEPAGSGLGGGGFFLLHRAANGQKIFVDARETAPGRATENMFIGQDGKPDPNLLRRGGLAAGIPGLPAGLVHLAEKYGELGLSRSLQPAIEAALKGFTVDRNMALRLGYRKADFAYSSEARAIFFADGMPLTEGATLRQKNLATTLKKLAAFGRDGFYSGPVAEELVRSVAAAGGIWSARDLQDYKVVERPPVILSYQDWQIVTAPPPSSGGLVLAGVFNMLDELRFDKHRGPAHRKHMLIEAMRRAYYDRARYMGDTDFVPVPSRQLMSRQHARDWLRSYSPRKATPSDSLQPEPIASVGAGVDTTHFSVLDAEGNRVAATLSINYPFGAATVAGTTGVLLNNEMDDFVAQPGVPNGYGLVGGEANMIEPGKRMLSSMTPTFLEGEARTAILGTPGGSRIITMVLLALLDLMDGAEAEATVAKPRFHHQYQPDVVQYEAGALNLAERNVLGQRGHSLEQRKWPYGNMQLVLWEHGGAVTAASDPRGVGAAKVIKAAAR